MKNLKLIISTVLTLTLLVGCPTKDIRKADPYIEDADKIIDILQDEYPEVKQAIMDSCEAGLIPDETCADFELLYPAIEKTLTTLKEVIAIYQNAVDAYEQALSTGTVEEQEDIYNQVMAAFSAVIGNTAELIGLYAGVVGIYQEVLKVGNNH